MLKVYGNNILTKRLGSEKETDSGVKRTSAQKEKPLIVEVIDSGVEGVSNGDVLMIARYSGIEIDYKKEMYLFIKPDDILAKIEEGEDK